MADATTAATSTAMDQTPGPSTEPEEVVMAEPESSNNNNNATSNNNNATNNNNNNNNVPSGKSKKEGKLPPCSSISNSSFLWDPDVDGAVNVNLPLVPQLITEVQPGDELTDLTELVGSELADLMAADPTIDSINRGDLFDLGRSNDMASYLE